MQVLTTDRDCGLPQGHHIALKVTNMAFIDIRGHDIVPHWWWCESLQRAESDIQGVSDTSPQHSGHMHMLYQRVIQ